MGNNVRRMIRVVPAVVLALLLAFQVVGAAPAHAASRPRQVGPNTCFWPADTSYTNNITINGTVFGFYKALVEHDSCNTSLHRGEALITLTASSSGCNKGSFNFEFDANGTQVEKTGLTGGPPNPSGTIGTPSRTDGATLDYVAIDSYFGSTFCTKMTLVHWEQAQDWPAIQAGTC